ncbi:MAG: cell division protein ZapA [Lachnospiraceae bacterium]|nr:cell division protein ZapA [Lachnospiraceae bacterium]
MASKTDVEVLIGGKLFTLSCYESEEYLHKVASYLNRKIDECSKIEGFKRQSVDTQSILMQLNIADDYFKAKKQISLIEDELQRKEKELYDLKHELVSVQMKMDNLERNNKELQAQNTEHAKRIVKLETELQK